VGRGLEGWVSELPVSDTLLERFKGVGLELLERLDRYKFLVVDGVEWVPVDDISPTSIAGVDSSRQHDVYRGFILYAIQGYAVSLSREGILVNSVGGSDAGFIEIVEVTRIGVRVARDSLLSSTSKTLEVTLLHDIVSFGDVELALLDGSYESFLGPILVFKGELRKASPSLAERIENSWKRRLKLLDKLSRMAKLIFISKSSSKANMVKYGGVSVKLEGLEFQAPDFMVVRRVLSSLKPVKPGFLWYNNPYMELRKGCDEIKSIAPRLSCWYTLTYVLLHPHGKPYQITMPGKLSREDVVEVVKQLKSISPSGYPQPLLIAHHLSRIKRDEFRKLVALLVPELETGREPLEQVLQ